MGRVQDKVALVTGGASGIGRATAELLAAEGAAVAVSDLQDQAGADVVAGIQAAGGQVAYWHHDVADEARWEAVIAEVTARFGGLHILVNNAGVRGAGTHLEEITLERWRASTSVNLDGVFLGVKHGIRAMRAGGGAIVNTSSILGFAGLPLAADYIAAKGGVRLLSKAAAIECAERGIDIRVNSVHPGFIDTAMVAGAIADRGAQLKERIERSQPTGRMGAPQDIAEGILYLVSDAARFVTGTELVIDGGYLAR